MINWCRNSLQNLFDQSKTTSTECVLNKYGLLKDDIQIIFTQVKIEKAVFEIDALERIESVSIPIKADGVEEVITCEMSDRHIWESYELLPGGWWARVG